MTFEEGIEKIKSILPPSLELTTEKGFPSFEIKVNDRLEMVGQTCFTLQSLNNSNKMNIKVNRNLDIIELYPIATKKDRRPFHLKSSEIKKDTYPYLSISALGETDPITHIYYLSAITGKLTRRDKNGNEREYTQYTFYNEAVKEIFDKYHPAYIFSYHPVGKPESPTAYLLGFNVYCKTYDLIKNQLF